MELFDEMTTYKLGRREYTKFIFEQFDIDDELILDRSEMLHRIYSKLALLHFPLITSLQGHS